MYFGGRALNTPTRRYERAEFDKISIELIDILKKDFKEVFMPLFYRNKQSFGDADILVSMEDFKLNMRAYILDVFHPNEIFHNGNCWSFDYKELQVDLITVPSLEFDASKHYFSYNDLGNFQGALMHQFTFKINIDDNEVDCVLKYGQEGFFLKAYYNSVKLGKIIISRDFDRIVKFIDLDVNIWKNGFNDLEDIFKYICDSKYFSWELFQLVNLNKINRERNFKRKSHMSFIVYIEQYKNTSKEKRFIFTNEWILDKLNNEFPEINITFDKLKDKFLEIKERESVSIKFNGNIIMDNFNLTGKDLGDAIVKFKNHISGDFNKYILETDSDIILKEFKKIL